MQRWLKKITLERHALEKLWCLKPFAGLGLDRCCWTFKRTTVIRAFSLGLLIAFVPPTPFLPLHLMLCTVFGIMFRLNIPVLFATVFVSNPITWFPQIAASIWVGAKLTGLDLMPMLHDLTHHNLWARLNDLWEPLLIGALVLGILAVGSGYALGQMAWRAKIIYRWRHRRFRSPLHQNPVD